jgi:hypothetical protein
MTTDSYEILASKYAKRTNRKRIESFISADDHDALHPIDYFVWVVRNEHRTIVIDTGFDETEARRRDRQLQRLPIKALSHVGVAAGGRDGLRHRSLHVSRASAVAVHRRTCLRTGAQGGRALSSTGSACGWRVRVGASCRVTILW